MKRNYKLTEAAEQDLVDIFVYTLEKWGEGQADNYIDALFNRFYVLAENPQLLTKMLYFLGLNVG